MIVHLKDYSKLLESQHLSQTEYDAAKVAKGFNPDDWKWNEDEQVWDNVLDECDTKKKTNESSDPITADRYWLSLHW